LGINRAYHGGKEMTKVRIAREDLQVLPLDANALEKVLRSLVEDEVKLSFE